MFRRSSRTSRTSKTSRPEQADLIRRVARDRVHQVFGPNVSPAITVNRGETIVVETQDCYRGLLTEEPDTHGEASGTGGIPVTGPIHVEEAHIGDVLSIQVKEIKTSDTGVFAVRSETGVPGQDIRKPDVRVLEVDENHVKLDDRIALPVRPVIGNLGVATKHGEIETVYPGRHGGNMDTLEITTGSRVYLPVQVNGALLSLGDVKACMGDGQIAGSGVEVAAEVTLRVDTQPGGRFSWPRVESKGEWITITSASTVDQAARLAITEMVKWISQDKGLDFDTAYALVSLGGGLRVSQWGNPLTTARMVFPKRLINKLKSVPTASGRLNYRTLPPAVNGDTGGEPVAAEAKPSASRSSSRSGSGRSQRSSGRSRQSGSRRGTRQRTNGAAADRADNSKKEAAGQQDEAVQQDAAGQQDEAVRQDAPLEQTAAPQKEATAQQDEAVQQDAAGQQDEATRQDAPLEHTAAPQKEATAENQDAAESREAGKENGRGDRAGRTGRGKASGRGRSSGRRRTSAAKKTDVAREPAEASAGVAGNATAAGNEPAGETASIAGEESETAAAPAVKKETKAVAAPAVKKETEAVAEPAAGDTSESVSDTSGGRGTEEGGDSGKNDSQAENGAQPKASDRNPAFGRRQRRTVRRA